MGILGGGQLARMLCLKAHEMGLSARVLSSSAHDPAAQVTQNWVKGSLTNAADLTDFLKSVKVATFESEFMSAALLASVRKEAAVQFFPTLPHMALLQDRWTQKLALKKSLIPTAPFVRVLQTDSYLSMTKKLKSPSFVIKKRFGGYDGYGTFIILSEADFFNYLKLNQISPAPAIAEVFVPFRRELAVTLARNPSGQIVNFPLVESKQVNSRCLWVKGPTQSKAAPALIRRLTRFLDQTKYVGVIAFELFEGADGALAVNEVAPRVHNSSHYSLNAFDVDQFSLHLKAILNHPLPKPQASTPGFAMYNLLGSGISKELLRTKENVQIHWYGKSENKPGRKMGHINAQGVNPNAALRRATRARKDLKV